jgi:hypothetical protein
MAVDGMDHCERIVAEHMSQHDRVHPSVKRPRRVAAAEEVGVDPLADPGPVPSVIDSLLDCADRQRLQLAGRAAAERRKSRSPAGRRGAVARM